ncbi:hypothetical protein CDL15_Pgr016215 [Punica granatum]|uniref:Uncharacterized protein n=1 Tax=Punica granatum TaxID=22663 RepID=A0A218X1Z7_PUNGR|nr:hypothetical protein CDL15_Pgr016215 [Punica granatum]
MNIVTYPGYVNVNKALFVLCRVFGMPSIDDGHADNRMIGKGEAESSKAAAGTARPRAVVSIGFMELKDIDDNMIR